MTYRETTVSRLGILGSVHPRISGLCSSIMKWSCMEFSLPVSGCVGAALMPCGLMFSRAGSGSCHHVQHHFGQAGCDLLGGKPPLWLEPPIDPRDHPGDCQGGKPEIGRAHV